MMGQDRHLPPPGAAIAVAMSGGVDSSTAAALLLELGYRVSGVTMRLWKEADAGAVGNEAVEAARRACDLLGIPLQVFDYREEFRAAVVDEFIATYSRGLTPNPCVVCNRQLKFGRLLDEIARQGIPFMATGHYARVDRRDGCYRLLKGRDPGKDQSYFLYRLTQNDLARLVFPLGDYTKQQVRQMARERHLPGAHRAESQETCFIHDNDYRRFIWEHAPDAVRPGPILDRHGQVLGAHKGLPFYTVGQRSGLGVAAAQPLFVLELDPARNALIVGPGSALGRSRLTACQVTYVSGCAPALPTAVAARIRYRAREAEASLVPLDGDRAEVIFAEPLRDITPGQSVVFYRGEELVGGGVIARQLHEPDC